MARPCDFRQALSEHVGRLALQGAFAKATTSMSSSSTPETSSACDVMSSPRPPRAPARPQPSSSTSTTPVAPSRQHRQLVRHARSCSPAVHTSAASDSTISLPSVTGKDADAASGTAWFVEQMNAFAARAGTIATQFSNPHGMDAIPDPNTHQSCAMDVARMTQIALQDPLFQQIVRTKKHTAIIKRKAHIAALEDPADHDDDGSSDADSDSGESVTFAVRLPRCASVKSTQSDTVTAPMSHTALLPYRLSWANTNKLLSHKCAADGVKTVSCFVSIGIVSDSLAVSSVLRQMALQGVTKLAGSCLCSRMDVNGRTVLIVVMG